MNDLDLNLLHVLVALYRTQSVSKAAAQLQLGQSSTSLALGRLRRAFNDPLFVRSRAGMLPTTRCTELADAASRAIAEFNSQLSSTPAFDRESSSREFAIALVDVGELHVLPRLMAHLNRAAPHCNLRSESLRAEEVAAALEDGRCDLAVGLFPNLGSTALQAQELSMQRMVSLVRVDHPQVRSSRVDLPLFLELPHVLVQPTGVSHQLFEAKLKEQGCARRVRLETSRFLSVPSIIAATDMIVTVPRPIADYYAGVESLRIVEPPVNIDPFPIRMFWHPRHHTDPAVGWLREAVTSLFGTALH